MNSSSIEWTDATWNPVSGCSQISPGCAKCYAKAMFGRPYPGRAFEDVRCHPERLEQPLRMRKPKRIFVNSVSDLFHEDVPDLFIDQVFAVMALARQHTYQILTKRAERMREYITTPTRVPSIILKFGEFVVPRGFNAIQEGQRRVNTIADGGWPLPNVWLGVSVENQHWADERIIHLVETPAAVRFISAEPLLGPVDLRGCWKPQGLDWVICGGESGPGARPFDVAWARSIIEQCKASDVPVFVKQLGANPYDGISRVDEHTAVMNTLYLRDRKGRDITEFAPDLQVREYPR